MTTLMDTLVDQLDDQTLHAISAKLGTDERSVEQAVSTALPLLLGALGRNAADTQGRQQLTEALRRDHDGSMLDNVGAVLARPEMLGLGSAILGHVLGRRQQNAVEGISRTSGLSSSQTTQLLALLAPLVMGSLGKVRKEQDLDGDGVADLLQQERRAADANLGGLSRILDMDGDGSIQDDMLSLGNRVLGGFLNRRK